MLCLPLQLQIPIPSSKRAPSVSLSKQQCMATLRKNDKFNIPTTPPCVVRSRLATTLPECGAGNEKTEMALDPALVPKHVAVIIDGFRRWGKSKGLNRLEAYEAGTRNMMQVARKLCNCGVQIISVFLVHPGSLDRPKEDVDFFLQLADEIVQENIEELMGIDVRVTRVGDRSRIPQSVLDLADSVEERAKNNKGAHVVLAVDYGGRYDITQAAKKIAGKVKDGSLNAEDIDETLFERHLETNFLDYPNPDLLIRTGGKFKLSNFMLWQLAYSELYVSDKLLPDFNEDDVVQALAEYQRRQRRYGAN